MFCVVGQSTVGQSTVDQNGSSAKIASAKTHLTAHLGSSGDEATYVIRLHNVIDGLKLLRLSTFVVFFQRIERTSFLS